MRDTTTDVEPQAVSPVSSSTPHSHSTTHAASSGTASPESQYSVHHASHGHEHPHDWTYIKIAIVLAVVTALEVATYYLEDRLGSALIPSLMVMMVVKFYLVARWFMHLKFDSPLFSKLFAVSMLTATVVYVAALAALEFWN